MSTAYVVIIKHLAGKVTLRNINSKFCTFINNISFLLFLHFSFFFFFMFLFFFIFQHNHIKYMYISFTHFMQFQPFYYYFHFIIFYHYYYHYLLFYYLLFIGLKLPHCDIYIVGKQKAMTFLFIRHYWHVVIPSTILPAEPYIKDICNLKFGLRRMDTH